MPEGEMKLCVSLDGVTEAVEAIRSLEHALGSLKREPNPQLAGRMRFEMLCIDLFRVMCRQRPELDAARTMVIGVESGEVARRHIGKFAAERFPDLSEADRAFAVGLAMGFMTEFLPREA